MALETLRDNRNQRPEVHGGGTRQDEVEIHAFAFLFAVSGLMGPDPAQAGDSSPANRSILLSSRGAWDGVGKSVDWLRVFAAR